MNNAFLGVVEDINDPRELGRVRVRIFGVHSENRELIPTEALPWALVVTPVTNPAMTGIGRSATGILQGSWVAGIFRDGSSAQEPLILGTVVSQTTGQPQEQGFSDPDGMYPHRPGAADMPVEATSAYRETDVYKTKSDLRQDNIEKAIAPNLTTVDPQAEAEERSVWSSLDMTGVAPVYPSNHVTHTESGHVLEVDDTPGTERISEFHKSGTYYEVRENGDRTTTIRGDNYSVTFGDDNVYVKGNVNMTVDSDVRLLIKGDYRVEVEGDYTEYVKGNRKRKVGGSEFVEVDYDFARNIGKNSYDRVAIDRTHIIDGNRKVVISGNDDLNVNVDRSYSVMGNRTEFTQGNEKIAVSGTSSVSITGDSKVGFAGSQQTTILKDLDLAIAGNSSVNVSGDSFVGIASNLQENVKGTVLEAYESDHTVHVTGDALRTVGGDDDETVSGEINTTATGDMNLKGSTINLN